MNTSLIVVSILLILGVSICQGRPQHTESNRTVLDTVDLEMWEDGCKGGWYRNNLIEDNVCFSWPKAGGDLRGIQMRTGSCVDVYFNTLCTLHNGRITENNVCYDASIYSASTCYQKHRTIRCPEGQLVKGMDISEDGLIGGLEIQCYSPQRNASATPNHVFPLLTSKVTNGVQKHCTEGIRGLSLSLDEIRQVVDNITPTCYAGTDGCKIGEVMVGITASVEDHTNAVKGISIICDVPSVIPA